MSHNRGDSDTEHTMKVVPEEGSSSDIPTRKDPRVSRGFEHKLLGAIPITVSPVNNNIEELKQIHDELISSIENEDLSKSGITFGFDEDVEQTLDKIDQLNPENIDGMSDIPEEIRDTATVGLIHNEYEDDLAEGISRVQDYFVRDETVFTSEVPISPEKSGKLLKYFAMASAIIEHRSAMLIVEKVISESHRDNEEITEFITEYLNQHKREELLYRSGIISGKFKNDLEHIRSKRNGFVHDPHERHYIVPAEAVEIIQTAFNCAESLDSSLIDILERRYVESDGESSE